MADKTDGSGTSGEGVHPPQQTREEFDAKKYPQIVKFVGRALIVNNVNFCGVKLINPEPRKGSERDEKEIYDLLLKLGFKEENIERHQNLTKKCLKGEIGKAAKKDYSDYGCFLCVVMSYGEPGIIICPGEVGESDERCELKDIQAPFTGDKCPSLATKPKIYFIMGNSNYVETHSAEGGKMSQPPVKLETRKIPRECNFITQYSSETDHGHWKAKKPKPSPYIAAVKEAFEKHVLTAEDMDILKVMTRINAIMAATHADIPLVTSLLTKSYHFRPKAQVS